MKVYTLYLTLFMVLVLCASTAYAVIIPRPTFFPSAFRNGLTGAAIAGSETSSLKIDAVHEQVKCIFSGEQTASRERRKCTSLKGSCNDIGSGSCTVRVTGMPGDSVIWTAACPNAGSAVTVVDGKDKEVKFQCGAKVAGAKTVYIPTNPVRQAHVTAVKPTPAGTPLTSKCLSGEFRLTDMRDNHWFGAEKCSDGQWVKV